MNIKSVDGTVDKEDIEQNGTTLTHCFYGIQGSQISFSLSPEAQAANLTLKVNESPTTTFLLKESTKTYTVQLFNDDDKVVKFLDSDNNVVASVTFTIISQMKPMTVTFTGLTYVGELSSSDTTVEIETLSIEGKAISKPSDTTSSLVVHKVLNKTNNITTLIEKERLENYSFELKKTTAGISITPNNRASISIPGASMSVTITSKTFTVSDLYGKTSVMWGEYLRLNYTITQ